MLINKNTLKEKIISCATPITNSERPVASICPIRMGSSINNRIGGTNRGFSEQTSV